MTMVAAPPAVDTVMVKVPPADNCGCSVAFHVNAPWAGIGLVLGYGQLVALHPVVSCHGATEAATEYDTLLPSPATPVTRT